MGQTEEERRKGEQDHSLSLCSLGGERTRSEAEAPTRDLVR